MRYYGSALLALFIVGCDGVSMTLEPDSLTIPLEEIIDLSRNAGRIIIANGTMVDTIVATIPRDARDRGVKFTTTKGKFADTGNAKEVTVLAVLAEATDARLMARVVLVADSLPGVAIVRGSIGSFADSVHVAMSATN